VIIGAVNILRITALLGLDPATKCDEGWIGISLTLQCLFIITLVFNVISVSLIRIELVTRIKNYFYYKPEPDIAIKY